MSIPKILHYVWLGGNPKPELFKRCYESWKKYLPDYEIKEWNESNFDFSESPYSTQAYELKKYGFVPDYIRAKVLLDYGGIYVDTDVEITKSFDTLLDNDFILSFENGAYIQTAVLGSVPNHPFSQMMVEFYKKHNYVENGKIDFTPSTPIWTYFLNRYYGLKMKDKTQILTAKINPDGPKITVFKHDYFCPLNFTTKKLKPTENTYAIHYFDASWFTGKLKRIDKFLKCAYYISTPALFTVFTRMYAKSKGRKIAKEDKVHQFAGKYKI